LATSQIVGERQDSAALPTHMAAAAVRIILGELAVGET
jgi:hypothetical protein